MLGGKREEYGLWQVCLIIFSLTIIYKRLLGSHIGQEVSISMNNKQSLTSICRWAYGGRDLHHWAPKVPLQFVWMELSRAKDHSHLGGGWPILNWVTLGKNAWMASLTQWTWVWANSRRWWRTGKPGVLQFMGHKELDMTDGMNSAELAKK